MGALRFRLDPRLVPAAKIARRLGVTLDEFRSDLPELLRHGLPRPCPVTGNYDLKAFEAWQDRRSGLVTGMPTLADDDAIIRQRLEALG